jgi:hypothetical protein
MFWAALFPDERIDDLTSTENPGYIGVYGYESVEFQGHVR